MQKNIYLPQLEINMEDVEIIKWLVKEGDFVHPEQNILEVETQKALNEIPSGETGYLRKCFAKVGDVIGENALICILTDSMNESFEEPQPASISLENPSHEKSTSSILSPVDKQIRASPAARKLAKESGITLEKIKGTGPENRITVEDVQNAVSKSKQKE